MPSARMVRESVNEQKRIEARIKEYLKLLDVTEEEAVVDFILDRQDRERFMQRLQEVCAEENTSRDIMDELTIDPGEYGDYD